MKEFVFAFLIVMCITALFSGHERERTQSLSAQSQMPTADNGEPVTIKGSTTIIEQNEQNEQNESQSDLPAQRNQ